MLSKNHNVPLTPFEPHLMGALSTSDFATIDSFLAKLDAEQLSLALTTLAYSAAKSGHSRTLHHILEHKAFPSEAPSELLVAALESPAAIPTLTTLFADTSLTPDTFLGSLGTPLTAAAFKAKEDVLCFLLERGGDPNLGRWGNDESQRGALGAAALGDASLELFEMLLSAGAEIKGSGALTVAAKKGNAEIVSWLISKGGSSAGEVESRTDRNGPKIALEESIDAGNEAVVKVLLRAGVDSESLTGRRRDFVSSLIAKADHE